MKIKANDDKVYDVPDNPVWHSGPPPEIGWWPASTCRDAERIRYWNGITWSRDCPPDFSEALAAHSAEFKAVYPGAVEWSDRWWLKGGK